MSAVDEDGSGAISFLEFMNMARIYRFIYFFIGTSFQISVDQVKYQKQLALDRDDEADMLSAFVALGGGRDMSGDV